MSNPTSRAGITEPPPTKESIGEIPATLPPSKESKITTVGEITKRGLLQPTGRFVKERGIYHGNCYGCQYRGNQYVCKKCYLKTKNKKDENCSIVEVEDRGIYIGKSGCTNTSKSTIQTFDSLIMECQNTLSIETEINKRYKQWLNKSKVKRPKLSKILKESFYLIPCLISIYGIYFFFKLALNYPIKEDIRFLLFMFFVGCLTTVLGFSTGELFKRWSKLNIKHWFFPEQPTTDNEELKFQFLKDAYVNTIDELNKKLNLIKEKITDQINAHTKDELSISEFSDIIENIEEPLVKIKQAINSLKNSYEKVTDKQREINEVLNEYIGENGYIAKKEKEIQRIKNAQELSERMKHNFAVTLEITTNIDLLADTIIPGIKQLMSFKIPELINKINYECDKQKVLLEIKQ